MPAGQAAPCLVDLGPNSASPGNSAAVTCPVTLPENPPAPQAPSTKATTSNKDNVVVAPSPQELAAIAADEAISLAPRPAIEVAPARVGLTGLESFVWLSRRPDPIAATAGVPGLVVTAEARPVQYLWDFGDGNDLVTESSGRPWTNRSPGDISHLYETKGTYELGVEVIWEARWRAGTGTWQSLGYFSNSDSEPYPVKEIVSALVPTG